MTAEVMNLAAHALSASSGSELGVASTLGLEWGAVGQSVLMVLFIGASVLLILAVLIQKPQGGGLATAFGAGSGSGQTAFGARTGDALTILTVILFALYLIAAVVLVWSTTPSKAPPSTATGTNTTAPAAAPADGTAPATTPANGTAPAPATTPAATPAPATTPPASTPPASAPSGGGL